MPIIRLDKMLSSQGFGTRKEIKELLRYGAVRVDDKLVKNADIKIDTEKVRISINGKAIDYKEHIYIMMNKPIGVVSASSDPKQRTVIDLLPDSLRRPGLFPVGRLDKDTEGLLIITDDGPFAHNVLSPKKHVEKRYFAMLDRSADNEDIAAFNKGVMLSNEETCLPAKLEICETGVLVSIVEGKYHQIKRMFESRNKYVIYLKRLSMGNLMLDKSLSSGGFRELSSDEIVNINGKVSQ